MKIDLHMHSYFSDGAYAPAVVVQKAAQAGCTHMALTDHDTVDGVLLADEEAKKQGIVNVHGVEVSSFDDGEVHILGYNIDIDNPKLSSLFAYLQERRRVRANRIVQNLAKYGIVIPDGYLEQRTRKVVSRAHIAKAIASLGYEPDFFVAMKRWLKVGAPTFVPNEGIAPEEAIGYVHAAGGVAVLAHPVRIQKPREACAAFIARLAKAGLDGLEAVYKKSSPQDESDFTQLAKANGLFITAGGDYHGDGNDILPKTVRVPFI